MADQSSSEQKLEAAKNEADSWLALIDNSSFEESWEKASTLFRRSLSKEAWVETIEKTLGMFGSVLSREERDRSYATELPGAPDGEYFTFVFASQMEKKKSATERVILMTDTDGTPRVSGYFIQ